MEFSLRPRQTEAITAIWDSFRRQHRNVLVSVATGFGKTILAAVVTEQLRCKGKRVMFVAHRHELLTQAADKMRFVIEASGGDPDDVEICSTEQQCYEAWVAIVSIQRASRWDLGLADRDFLIVDECHHATSATYRRLFERLYHHNPKARTLGLTATAFRADDQVLGDIYDDVAYQMDVATLIEEGWLTPLRCKVIELGVDLDGVRKINGDFDSKQLSELVNTPEHNDAVVDQVIESAPSGKIILFATSIEHSEALVERFNQCGITAASLHHKVKRADKDRLIAEFRSGAIQVLSNVDLLTEGFDCEEVDTVVCVRETLSPIVFAQSIGRALRLHPKKPLATVLDFTSNTSRHTLGMPPQLTPDKSASKEAQCQETVCPAIDESEPDLNDNGMTLDPSTGDWVIKPISVTEYDLVNSRFAWEEIDGLWILVLGVNEGALVIWSPTGPGGQCYLEHLHRDADDRPVTTTLAGPLDQSFCMSLAEKQAMTHNTFFSQRTRAWRAKPITANQETVLRRYGVHAEELTRGQASARIAAAMYRRERSARAAG